MLVCCKGVRNRVKLTIPEVRGDYEEKMNGVWGVVSLAKRNRMRRMGADKNIVFKFR